MFDRSHRILSPAIWLAIGVLATVAPSYAQYPGHIDTAKKSAPMPRSIAVVEWTGAEGDPKASRIIPIAVYDGESYQPGGLYLARPEPLAVETGTEYILQVAGIPQGLFDVRAAQDVEGYWLGYGTWKPLAPAPRPHKLAPAKVMPQVVGREDSRPHFKNSTPAGTPDGKQGGASPTPTSTPQSGSSSDQASQADPDRPTLRRRTAAAAEDAKAAAISNSAETIVGGADPDRPHMAHGSAHPTDPGFEASKLEGAPSNLQQMIAVSDAIDREPHPYTYAWADPGDAAKMQAQMATLAQKALAPPAPATGAAATKPAPKRRATTSRPASHAHVAPKAGATLPALSGVVFHAFQLTYDSGATLVLSAQSIDAAGNARYITVIGQPDFYGAVHVIFQSITDDAHLDETPKMLLVDAVDPKADNRGDLVFELRGRHDRQFAIYRVGTGQVEQVFTTGSLSLTPVPETPDSPDS